MKDINGFYYYPNPNDHKAKVYVRNGANGIEFRLWHNEKPEIWEKHEWLNIDIINAAAAMYKERGQGSDPTLLYDIRVAEALLK
ncbi:hypothetical protein [Desulfovibrio litoralis]|uniref:Uncharacterized protein n=1 Tax=Desulfovibrio litoralis DSM 11393 TaxID=1121455 RepID=A0A1M7TK49_9BACT|nr:hypothetical protein [Desulfovibrio litoralis]SHN71008.1 hypothetical protein SAMN02745728_02124 [Desulfovibrio litoralis DSM 11393]